MGLRLDRHSLRRAIVASDTAWLERSLAWYALRGEPPPNIDDLRLLPLDGMLGVVYAMERTPLLLSLWTCAMHFSGARTPRFDAALALHRLLLHRVQHPPPRWTCYGLLHLRPEGRHAAGLPVLTLEQHDAFALLCLEALCEHPTWWPTMVDTSRLPLSLVCTFRPREALIRYLLAQFAPHLRRSTLARLVWATVYSSYVPVPQARALVAHLLPLVADLLPGYDRCHAGTTLLHVAAWKKPALLLDLLPYLGAFATARNLLFGETPLQAFQRLHGRRRVAMLRYGDIQAALRHAEHNHHPALRRAVLLRQHSPLLARLSLDLLRRIVRLAEAPATVTLAHFQPPPLVVLRRCALEGHLDNGSEARSEGTDDTTTTTSDSDSD